MKFSYSLVGVSKLGFRQYEISSARETAEIRGRLMRGIRARLRAVANTFFVNDAKEVGDGSRSMGRQWRSGD